MRDPRATIRLTGDALAARAIVVPHLTAALGGTSREIRIDDARAALFGGQIQGRGTFPLAKDGRLDVTLAVADADLAVAVLGASALHHRENRTILGACPRRLGRGRTVPDRDRAETGPVGPDPVRPRSNATELAS